MAPASVGSDRNDHDPQRSEGSALTPKLALDAAALMCASTSSAMWGGALLFTYSLGLGIPFLLLAYVSARGGRVSSWLRRRARVVEFAGGAVLVLMGVLMFTGQWVRLFSPLLRLFSRANWPPL